MGKQKQQEEKVINYKVTTQTKEIVKPTLFYGNLDEDIDSWLKNYDRISVANEWSEERKLTTLPAFLRDRAADYYETLEEGQKLTFAALCENLKARFMPKELQSLYYSNLFLARQKEFQSVEDFASEINKLATRAYSDMPREQQDGLTREHFVQGLKPEIKRFVLVSNPQTFEEAFRHAKREECNFALTYQQRPNEAACAVGGAQSSVEKSVRELAEHMKVMSVQMNNMSRGYRGRGRGYGGRGGRRPYGPPRGRGGRNLRTTDGRPICNFCWKVGHIEISCEEKNKGNE